MFATLRIVLLGSGLVIGTLAVAPAQPPPVQPARSAEPNDTDTVEQQIQDALSGNVPKSLGGNPLLDGVFDAIHQRGSILDNSLLGHANSDLMLDQLNLESTKASLKSPTVRSSDAKIAELLLRTARLLEQRHASAQILTLSESVRADGQDRDEAIELVERMRRQAAKLLLP